MAVGDINIESFTIGSINVADPSKIVLVGLNIYEDILDPYGPVAEARFTDFQDVLGSNKVNGKEDVTISFSTKDMGGNATYKFKLAQNKNLNDQSQDGKGSMHSKQFDLRFVSPEVQASLGNFIPDNYEDLTGEIAKKILKDGFKTQCDISIEPATKGKRRFDFKNKHPLKCLQILNMEHVSSKNKSSCYAVFKTREGATQKYKIAEYEELFTKGSVATLKQKTTLATGGASETDKQNSLIWFNGADSFNSSVRAWSKPEARGYDPTTGVAFQEKPKDPPKFQTADGSTVYDSAPASAKAHPVYTHQDSANDKTDPNVAEARKNRIAFLAHLAQNAVEFEIPGNPNITLGSMVTLDIPNKSSGGNNESGESQLNGKALVVAIRHKVRPLGTSPRYTMIIRAIKASFKEGSGGNG